MFGVISSIISFVLSFMDGLLGLNLGGEDARIGVLGGIFNLILFVPTFIVNLRRLHDIGRSGWWYLILVIPILGWIVYFIFMVTDSQPGSNEWGPNPKGTAPVQGGAWG